MFGTRIAERCCVNAGEQIFSRAHEDRTEGQMQLIDEPCAKILLDGCDTAADSYVPFLCSVFRTLERGMDSVGDEVKRCSAFHLDRLTRMVGQNKRRDMIWRFLAPPSLPRLIRPGATHRSEHVSPENP